MQDSEPHIDREPSLPRYRVTQATPTANIGVHDFDSLVTHHLGRNRHARVDDGVIVQAEVGRTHAVVGGEIQEIRLGARSATGVEQDRVLFKKDFILEDSRIARGARACEAMRGRPVYQTNPC